MAPSTISGGCNGKHLVRAYFNTTPKGRSLDAQSLLRHLQQGVATAQYGSFTLEKGVVAARSLYFHIADKLGEVYYEVGQGNELPAELAVLKPVRIVLTGSHHFNFPEEGIYEGGGEVIWSSTWHNTDYNSQSPVAVEHTWRVTIEAATVEAAYEQLRRIRTGEAPLKHRWVNKLSTSQPHETGIVEMADREDEPAYDPYDEPGSSMP